MADYYQLLEVPADASAATIRQSYARLARDRHPDRFTDPEEKKKAEAAFTQLTEAFNTLSNEKSRREYDVSRSAPKVAVPEQIARQAFERGLKHFEEREYYEAVELLRTAVQHQPQEARYHAALAQALARNPHWAREAIQHMDQAIHLAPQRAIFQAQLAELLLGQGLKLRARRAAEAALRLDPNERTALAVLQAAEKE